MALDCREERVGSIIIVYLSAVVGIAAYFCFCYCCCYFCCSCPCYFLVVLIVF